MFRQYLSYFKTIAEIFFRGLQYLIDKTVSTLIYYNICLINDVRLYWLLSGIECKRQFINKLLRFVIPLSRLVILSKCTNYPSTFWTIRNSEEVNNQFEIFAGRSKTLLPPIKRCVRNRTISMLLVVLRVEIGVASTQIDEK